MPLEHMLHRAANNGSRPIHKGLRTRSRRIDETQIRQDLNYRVKVLAGMEALLSGSLAGRWFAQSSF